MAGLEGVRVIELGGGVSAAYAAKLMADLGADVVKVEPPEGDWTRTRGPFRGDVHDPEASGLFLYLNTNKRSVVVDPDTPRDRKQLEALMRGAALIVHNIPAPDLARWGLEPGVLTARRPDLVVCAITPFGLTGPHAGFAAEELTTQHAGGWAFLSPGASKEADQPPLKAFGHQADFQGGLAGATAALAALKKAGDTGVGEHIDLSSQAYVASLIEAGLVTYTYVGLVPSRLGARGLNPWSMFECSDGRIFLCCIEEDQWQRLVKFMGEPEWASLELFADMGQRLMNADALEIFIQEWITGTGRTVNEIFHAGQKERICFAPVLDMAGLARERHIHERGFFTEVDHAKAGKVLHLAAPYTLGKPWWKVRRAAPTLGEHTESLAAEAAPRLEIVEPAAKARKRLPLEGIRVADFTWVWAGPFCAMHLAHLGAEVIKVESEGRMDLGRRLPIFVPETTPTPNSSGYFNQWNQGKKSLQLDLGHRDALEVAQRLVADCDVLVENFATGVMDRLGLGFDALREVRPDLIYASLSGYGDSGPYREYMGYGPAVAPLTGLSSLTGYAGGGPREIGLSIGDPTAGITAAVAICAALIARDRDGGGQHIDVSLWESTAALAAEGWMDYALNGTQPPRMGNRDPHWAPHNCFRCAGDDDWVTIACRDDTSFRALASVVGGELSEAHYAAAADRKNDEDALDAAITAWTRQRGRWEVTRALQAVGVAAFPSMSPADLTTDAHLEARGFFERLDHPDVGRRTHAGLAWRLTNAPHGVRSPAPSLGAHTDEVLASLGYSQAEIAAMRANDLLV